MLYKILRTAKSQYINKGILCSLLGIKSEMHPSRVCISSFRLSLGRQLPTGK